MAYTSVIPVHRLKGSVEYILDEKKTSRGRNAKSLEEAVDYALNRAKTEQDLFESAIACTCKTAFEDMCKVKEMWHKTGGVQGFHLVQSFAAGEVTPELAHQIGLEFAGQLLQGKYQVVVSTHLNTGHIHNHIVWNSVAIQDGKKYHSNAKSYYTEVRAISDKLCRQHGLSVIEEKGAGAVGRPYSQWLAEQENRPTWKAAIQQDIDSVVAEVLTWNQFTRKLEEKGYALRMNRKYMTLQPPGKARPVRFKTLGKNYTPEAIRRRILYPPRLTPAGKKKLPPGLYAVIMEQPGKHYSGLRGLYVSYLFEVGVLPRKPRYQEHIEEIEEANPHDRQEITSNDGVFAINWPDVLAVFSSKVAGAAHGSQVASLDDVLVDELRTILWEMNDVDYSTHTESCEVEVTTTNDEGEEETSTETVTETVLEIVITHKQPEEMAVQYAFDSRQNEYLALMTDPDNQSLWAELLGGFIDSGGQIITPDADWVGSGGFQWPLPQSYPITSQFGYRQDPFTGEITYHNGTDIAAPAGTPILAAADGMVTIANGLDPWGGSYGYHVKIDHGNGYETLYAHCSAICVTAGQQVSQGEVIGYVGSTGNSTGNHLHFEVWQGGQRTDAMGFFVAK